MKQVQITKYCLAGNFDILTSESRCPRCNKKSLRPVIMTIEEDRKVDIVFIEDPNKANNLCCNECCWLNYDFKDGRLSTTQTSIKAIRKAKNDNCEG